MTTPTANGPDALRPIVHQELDALDPIELEAVHRLILGFRMDRSLERLDALADEAREQGALARLPAIVAEVRARRRTTG
ncbi:MAG: hypothetical protein KIT22_10540 [Verrucomicrobiae bacterium]|nr:hypothetical protein [Verrucomicrobiae bacterium]